MKMISVFHNKGGVGKTTLLYHVACALAEKGEKVLLIDLDPQSNLTLYGLDEERVQEIWFNEERYINEGFPDGINTLNSEPDNDLLKSARSIHFLLKPVESGVDDYVKLPPPCNLSENLYLIPGSITLSQFETVLADRWSNPIDGDVLSIRTMTQFRTISKRYSAEFGFDFVLVDVSPSLGLLNRAIVTTCDSFFMPVTPDLFSMYGIRNIGQSLNKWEDSSIQIENIKRSSLRALYPEECVKFMGYTIYKAQVRNDQELGMVGAHRNYALRMPEEIAHWIPKLYVAEKNKGRIKESIGQSSVWFTHNTYPTLAQKYKCPIWTVPSKTLDTADANTVRINKQRMLKTREDYSTFADDFLSRL